MFPALICPSSGVGDYVVELPHWLYCSWVTVCWILGAVRLGWYPGCRQPGYHKIVAKLLKIDIIDHVLGSCSIVAKNSSKYSMNTYSILHVKSLDLKHLKHNGFYKCPNFNNNRLQFTLAVYERLHFL